MGFTFTTMSLNLVLLMAMVATNILSLYHLSTTLQSPKSTKPPPSAPVPDQLLRQLHTIRATINQLTRLQPNSKKSTIPPDLLLYSHLSPIASSCHNHPDLLHKYMTYTAFSLCPSDSDLAESLILRGCHPLPRRRCFSRTPKKQQNSLPQNPFPSSLPDSGVIWDHYTCKSFDCLNRRNPNLGFDTSRDASKFTSYSDELDLPVQQLLQIAKSAKSVLRLGLDVGGGTGSFAAAMRLRNVTVLTTTMSVAAPYSEAVALRGLVPLHVPLQQRLPLFDGVVDVIRCGRAVNRWIPATMMEFLLFDLDRVLRGGGYLWLDHFFSKGVDLEKVYAPLIGKLGYKKVKWATGNKTDAGGVKHGEVYLTVLLQKPLSR
ncbi:probable methyltransferase At1g29790 [Lotus japonicus]|uniref:probable methyltransferase At1g29790 n=1 Tax=Lotus japonicus TaxID=34305 RepID=UPI0025842F0A|nr:probable methyltransferase At1g29790 [Lotus japonicus]XP_057416760.1 probable methyltransferase At1g29790 [Lotus japonicus]XP_057416762.1 probable methyltransferase At1g29790 [Lotus japonicus]XP_057416763.1 probable methyltransferase At1g29790 [Lotus japonicus]XP_057416764.1 probable methyltransferase At1g29790 [Lotus japonicus]XP_057416765.1 probable methyltransferase At1g29790 [Lotus japonicus]